MSISAVSSPNALTQLYEGLSSDTKPTVGVQAFSLFKETDTGATYEYSGASWNRYSSSGTDSFKPSAYTGKVTSVNAGVSIAMASGATDLLLQSLEHTGMEEYAVLAFGESAATAIDNLNISANASTTGTIIRSGDSTAGGVAPDHVIGIPYYARDGGYAALGNGVAGTDQVVMVTQGVK